MPRFVYGPTKHDMCHPETCSCPDETLYDGNPKEGKRADHREVLRLANLSAELAPLFQRLHKVLGEPTLSVDVPAEVAMLQLTCDYLQRGGRDSTGRLLKPLAVAKQEADARYKVLHTAQDPTACPSGIECPKCYAELIKTENTFLMSNPPRAKLSCSYCGYTDSLVA